MKLKVLIALLLSLLLVFSSCGGSSGGEQSTEPDGGTNESTEESTAADTSKDDSTKDSGGDNELTLWTWSPIPRTAEKMVAEFQAKNPDIKVNYTNYNYNPEYLAALASASASDNLPDIVGLQPGSLTQQYRDYLIPMNDYAKTSWGDNWKDSFYGIAADQITLGNPDGDDSAYIIPIESQIINIIYNKKMFEEHGIKVPTTYEELKTASKTLTEKNIAPFWLGGADGWQNVNLYLMLASQIDIEMVDKAQNGEIKWTDEKLVQAMTNWKKMHDDGIFQTGALSNTSYPQGVNALTSNGCGMIALGSWWFQEYTADDVADTVADWSFDNFYLPAVESGLKDSQPIGGVDFGYGITQNCKNPDAAWKAIESFASKEGIQACIDDLNNLPAFKGIEPQGDIPDTIKTQMNSYSSQLDVAMNQRIGEPTIETALQNALAGVAAGELTPQDAMQAVQDAQDKL